MFPLTSNEAYIKSTGERSTLGRMLEEGGNEPIEAKLDDEVKTRAALGAHNLLENKFVTGTKVDVLCTRNADGTITLDGTANGDSQQSINDNITNLKNGNYVYTVGDSTVVHRFYGWDGENWVQLATGTGKVNITVSNTYSKYMATFVLARTVVYDTTLSPMICLATDANPTYQPYAMTNQELTANATNNNVLLDLLYYPKTEISNVDLDTISATGIYRTTGGLTHSPGGNYGVFIHLQTTTANARQFFMGASAVAIYTRIKDGGTWGSWYTVTLTT